MAWGKIGNIKGPKGDKGDKGDAGSVGPPGPAGSALLSGASAPTGGRDGDFFYRTDTHTLYGPKAGGAWPASGFALQGPAGAKGDSIHILSAVSDWAHLPATGNNPGDIHFVTTGTGHAGNYAVWALKAQHANPPNPATDYEWQDMGHMQGPAGTSVLTGTGAPGTGVGAIGDVYFDKSAKALYGPKTSAGWGGPIPLTGATGQNGAPGARGAGWFTGSGAPATVAGSAANDLYLDTVSGDIYKLS